MVMSGGLEVFVSGPLVGRRAVKRWVSSQEKVCYLRTVQGRDVYALKTDSGLLLRQAQQHQCKVSLM